MLIPYATEKTVFGKVRNHELASVEYAVSADLSRPLSSAFALTVTLRVLEKTLGSTTVDPIVNGPLTLTLGEPVGYQIKGRIEGWAAIDTVGNPVTVTEGSWAAAAALSFMVVAIEDKAVPLSVLLAPLTLLNKPMGIAASVIGNKIKLTIGHKRPIVLPIYRDETGNPIYPPVPLDLGMSDSSSSPSEDKVLGKALVRSRLATFATAAQAALRVGPQYAQSMPLNASTQLMPSHDPGRVPDAMNQFTPEENERIVAALIARGVSMDCLSCVSENSRRTHGYMITLPSPGSVPLRMIATACSSCANVQLHALPGLGLEDIVARFENAAVPGVASTDGC